MSRSFVDDDDSYVDENDSNSSMDDQVHDQPQQAQLGLPETYLETGKFGYNDVMTTSQIVGLSKAAADLLHKLKSIRAQQPRAVNSIEIRPATGGGFRHIALQRKSNFEALLIQFVGMLHEGYQACTSCRRNAGPFKDCVTSAGAAGGSCGNCHVNSESKRCTFWKEDHAAQPARDPSPQPSTRSRNPSRAQTNNAVTSRQQVNTGAVSPQNVAGRQANGSDMQSGNTGHGDLQQHAGHPGNFNLPQGSSGLLNAQINAGQRGGYNLQRFGPISRQHAGRPGTSDSQRTNSSDGMPQHNAGHHGKSGIQRPGRQSAFAQQYAEIPRPPEFQSSDLGFGHPQYGAEEPRNLGRPMPAILRGHQPAMPTAGSLWIDSPQLGTTGMAESMQTGQKRPAPPEISRQERSHKLQRVLDIQSSADNNVQRGAPRRRDEQPQESLVAEPPAPAPHSRSWNRISERLAHPFIPAPLPGPGRAMNVQHPAGTTGRNLGEMARLLRRIATAYENAGAEMNADNIVPSEMFVTTWHLPEDFPIGLLRRFLQTLQENEWLVNDALRSSDYSRQ